MRYQHGMAVGHTYMRTSWPPPYLPSIPSDFDYHLSFPEGDEGATFHEDAGFSAPSPLQDDLSDRGSECEEDEDSDQRRTVEEAEDSVYQLRERDTDSEDSDEDHSTDCDSGQDDGNDDAEYDSEEND